LELGWKTRDREFAIDFGWRKSLKEMRSRGPIQKLIDHIFWEEQLRLWVKDIWRTLGMVDGATVKERERESTHKRRWRQWNVTQKWVEERPEVLEWFGWMRGWRKNGAGKLERVTTSEQNTAKVMKRKSRSNEEDVFVSGGNDDRGIRIKDERCKWDQKSN
jgi:hypothetical protein